MEKGVRRYLKKEETIESSLKKCVAYFTKAEETFWTEK